MRERQTAGGAICTWRATAHPTAHPHTSNTQGYCLNQPFHTHTPPPVTVRMATFIWASGGAASSTGGGATPTLTATSTRGNGRTGGSRAAAFTAS